MARLQETLRALMHDLKNDLRKDPLPPELELKLCKSEAEWGKLRSCQENVRAMCPGDPIHGEVEELKALYLKLNDRVQVALEERQAEEKARLEREERAYRARLLGERLKFSHEELDRIVTDVMTQLKGEIGPDVGALEVFNIQLDATKTRLDFAGELLGTAQAMIDQLISDFPE